MSISHNIPKVVKDLKRFHGNVKFATAKACNDLAIEAQQQTLNKTLPNAFTLRAKGAPWQKPGNRFGFNIKFASKEKPEAVLGSRADWLKHQEEGGTRTASGGHRRAIPAEDYKRKEEIMEREKKPRAILADIRSLEAQKAKLESEVRSNRLQRSRAEKQVQHDRKLELRRVSRDLRTARKAFNQKRGATNIYGSKAFIATMSSGFTGIFRRLTPKRGPIKLLFSLTRYSKLIPILGFKQATRDLVNERYDSAFTKRLVEALQ